ncbi:MAG TPA: adenylate/guanylate cyclase domain-containing protein [Actinomycetota bacterium]|jgi:class 3 adenylate cyclase|nr:adenylate/guanylate cyclase domain-containing protein [Actinomycetota bacterium]
MALALRRLPGWIERMATGGTLASDSEEARLQKSVLTLFALLMGTLGSVWVITYWALGLRVAPLIPFAYQVVAAVSLVTFFVTKRYRLFRASQLTLALVLPFVFQLSLGGYVSGSGVVVWSFTAPMGALMFVGARAALGWLMAFFGALAAAALLDPVLPTVDIPGNVVIVFFVLNVAGVAATTFLLLRYFVRERDRAHRALAAEREKSERLLLNVLPQPIANRLKSEERIIADGFADVSVLFADIVDFTPLSERLSPEDVVALLDEVFTAFDRLADDRGLEKIKTIGDAYMVAGGLPVRRPDHVRSVAEMALGILQEVARCAERFGAPLSVRIGIDVGPVVAGVIGRRKFIYDLWGDTVNTASRMESHGLPGTIQVTRRAYERLRDRYEFKERRGVIVKGKGKMTTYRLVGRRPSPVSPSTAAG